MKLVDLAPLGDKSTINAEQITTIRPWPHKDREDGAMVCLGLYDRHFIDRPMPEVTRFLSCAVAAWPA